MAAAASGCLCIGVDGGGTKTKIVVFDARNLPAAGGKEKEVEWTVDSVQKRVLSEVTVGGTNQNSVGAEAAAKHLTTGILSALEKVDLDAAAGGGKRKAVASDVRHICLAMSGCDRASDIALIHDWIRSIAPHAKVSVYNDSVGALAGATFGQLYGVVLIAGTGMIAMGYDGVSTEPKRTGGWGSFIDDGSGYSIGCGVLKAAVHSDDGIGASTVLQKAVLDHLKLSTYDDLLGWVYSDPENLGWAKFAALAPLAFAAEAKGDAVARTILTNASVALAQCVTTLAKKLKFTDQKVPVVFSGGVITSEPLGNWVWSHIVKSLPNAVRLVPKVDAAVGAALLATKQ